MLLQEGDLFKLTVDHFLDVCNSDILSEILAKACFLGRLLLHFRLYVLNIPRQEIADEVVVDVIEGLNCPSGRFELLVVKLIYVVLHVYIFLTLVLI